jgi:hypothetical protein
MRLPRWLVHSLLLISAVSGTLFSTWWWVTWPRRTAREFVNLLASGERQLARRMFDESPGGQQRCDRFFESYVPIDWREAPLTPKPRDLGDVIAARQKFATIQGLELSINRNSVDTTPRKAKK